MVVQAEYIAVPMGEEDEFVEQWQGSGGTLVIVFNAAATPESEVQATLARELKQRFDGRTAALLDLRKLASRGGNMDSRIQLWRSTLSTVVDELWMSATTKTPQ